MSEDFLRILGMWALVHELADDAWKAAVARGEAQEGGPGGDAMDSLALLVSKEKERLRSALESGDATGLGAPSEESLAELRFEIGELRGRLDSIEALLEGVAERLEER